MRTESTRPRICGALVALALVALGIALFARSLHSLLREVEPNTCNLIPSMAYFIAVPVPIASRADNPFDYRLLRAIDYRSDPSRIHTMWGGVPVLFVHGHRGDYQQISNLVGQAASEWHRVQAEEAAAKTTSIDARPPPPLDFFTIDMREDSSAFHGDLVRVQAAFFNRCVATILAHYEAFHAAHPPSTSSSTAMPPPRSVLVIAHSMGGVVVRFAATLPNFVPGSVHTIVSIASPVRASPYLGDASIPALYASTHRFWSRFRAAPQLHNNIADEASANQRQPNDDDTAIALASLRVRVQRMWSAAAKSRSLLDRVAVHSGDKNAQSIPAATAAFSRRMPWNWDWRHGSLANVSCSQHTTAVLSDIVWVSIMGGARDTIVRTELGDTRGLFDESRSVFATSSSVDHVWMELDHDFGVRCQHLLHVVLHALNQHVRLARAPSLAVGDLLAISQPEARIAVWRRWLESTTPQKLGLVPRFASALAQTGSGTWSHVASLAPAAVAAHTSSKSNVTDATSTVPTVFVHSASDFRLEHVRLQASASYLFPIFASNAASAVEAASLRDELVVISNLPAAALTVSLHATGAVVPPECSTGNHASVLLLGAELCELLHSLVHSKTQALERVRLRNVQRSWSTRANATLSMHDMQMLLPPDAFTFEQRYALQFDASRLPPASDQLPGTVWRLPLGTLCRSMRSGDGIGVELENAVWLLEIRVSPPSSVSSRLASHFLIAQRAPASQITAPVHDLDQALQLPNRFTLSHRALASVSIASSSPVRVRVRRIASSADRLPRSCALSNATRFHPALFFHAPAARESAWRHRVDEGDSLVSIRRASDEHLSQGVFQTVAFCFIVDPCSEYVIALESSEIAAWIEFLRVHLHSVSAAVLCWCLLALSRQLLVIRRNRTSKSTFQYLPTMNQALTHVHTWVIGVFFVPFSIWCEARAFASMSQFGAPSSVEPWISNFDVPSLLALCLFYFIAWSLLLCVGVAISVVAFLVSTAMALLVRMRAAFDSLFQCRYCVDKIRTRIALAAGCRRRRQSPPVCETIDACIRPYDLQDFSLSSAEDAESVRALLPALVDRAHDNVALWMYLFRQWFGTWFGAFGLRASTSRSSTFRFGFNALVWCVRMLIACMLFWMWFLSPYLGVLTLTISLLVACHSATPASPLASTSLTNARAYDSDDDEIRPVAAACAHTVRDVRHVQFTFAVLFIWLCVTRLPQISLLQRGNVLRFVPTPHWFSFLNQDHVWTLPILRFLWVCARHPLDHATGGADDKRASSLRVVGASWVWCAASAAAALAVALVARTYTYRQTYVLAALAALMLSARP